MVRLPSSVTLGRTSAATDNLAERIRTSMGMVMKHLLLALMVFLAGCWVTGGFIGVAPVGLTGRWTTEEPVEWSGRNELWWFTLDLVQTGQVLTGTGNAGGGGGGTYGVRIEEGLWTPLIDRPGAPREVRFRMVVSPDTTGDTLSFDVVGRANEMRDELLVTVGRAGWGAAKDSVQLVRVPGG